MSDEATSEAAEPDDERLEELGGRIEQARDRAREVLDEPDQKFHDSGETAAEHDQAIAPPG